MRQARWRAFASVKRVAAHTQQKYKQEEEKEEPRGETEKERRASAATTFPEETGGLRDQSSPE